MDKETSFRPALFGQDGQYLLRVRGIRLTPASPEPWVTWAGLRATGRASGSTAFRWYIHREWNAAFALPEMISMAEGSKTQRLMASGQLVACGPVSNAQRQMLKQMYNRAMCKDRQASNSIPAGLSTEKDFRTLTQMFVRHLFDEDPETTFYVSGCSVRACPRSAGRCQTRRGQSQRAERAARHRA